MFSFAIEMWLLFNALVLAFYLLPGFRERRWRKADEKMWNTWSHLGPPR